MKQIVLSEFWINDVVSSTHSVVKIQTTSPKGCKILESGNELPC